MFLGFLHSQKKFRVRNHYCKAKMKIFVKCFCFSSKSSRKFKFSIWLFFTKKVVLYGANEIYGVSVYIMGYAQIVQKYNLRLIFAASIVTGVMVELVMIKFEVGDTNFYKTFREREVTKAAEKILELERRRIF